MTAESRLSLFISAVCLSKEEWYDQVLLHSFQCCLEDLILVKACLIFFSRTVCSWPVMKLCFAFTVADIHEDTIEKLRPSEFNANAGRNQRQTVICERWLNNVLCRWYKICGPGRGR